jgi:hypothetical protein
MNTADQTHITHADPSLAYALPIVVKYRLFQDAPVRTKTFGITPEARASFFNFITSMGAKAVEEEYTTPKGGKSKRWVLVDRGQVDYMSVGFTDPVFEAAKLAKAQQAKAKAQQLIAAWRAGKAGV